MRMKHAIRELWVEALKSGRYRKTTGRLGVADRDGAVVSNCALGVLCELAVEQGVIDRVVAGAGMIKYGGRPNGSGDIDMTTWDIPPRPVIRWAGLVDGPFPRVEGDPIVAINDHSDATLDQIGKMIDEDPQRSEDLED